MKTHSLFRWTIAVGLVILSARAANAACVISGVKPSYVPLPTMGGGQDFLFLATAGCKDLRFSVPDTTFSKTPNAGPDEGSKDRTYKVVLTPSEWSSLIGASDTTFRWSIIGTTSAGVTTRVTTTSELDFDNDYWTRSAGDVGACDHAPTINPGVLEICDGIDQDCDGRIDENVGPWFRDADGDGYGDGEHRRCAWAEGYVDVGGDCDDSDSAVWCPTLPLSRADAKLVGEASDFAGESVSGAGDIDGDGHDDLLVGAFSAGVAYVVLGPVTGTLDLSLADATLVGEENGAGISVSGAGDVDGDCLDDMLVGAPYNAEGGRGAGAAYLILGPVSGTLDLSLADGKLVGEAGDAAGPVSGAGDVDGDGHNDLLVGAGHDDEGGASAGAAYLVLGPVTGTLDLSFADAKLVGEEAEDEAGASWTGRSVSGAGDVDGDGNDDLLVGAVGNAEGGWYAGAAYLVLGPVTGTLDLSLADAKVVGGFRGFGYVGWSVSSAGDVDADGHDDVLVGTGSVAYMVLGPVTGGLDASMVDATFVGDLDLGWSVATAGDVDGDGHDDLLMGAPGSPDGGYYAGAAYLVLGPVTGRLDVSHTNTTELVGETTYAEVGNSVSGAGDVDGDGHDDLLIGAHHDSEGGNYAGAAYVVYGGGL